MVETAGPKPEIINPGVNEAMAKSKANPTPGSIWDVVRNLGQGELTIVHTVSQAHTSAFDPTSLPGDLVPSQSVLAINVQNLGPVLVAFTARNVQTMLPPDDTQKLEEQQLPALQIAAIAAKEPYAGLVIDPGSETSQIIPGTFLKSGIPLQGTNPQAKALLSNPNLAKNPGDAAAREQLVRAIATGPVYTPVEKAAFEATGEFKFPLIPLGTPPAPGETPAPDSPAAVVFGTSPAEIAAAFPVDQWVPIAVRLNDVVATVRQSANVKMVVINPLGPTLQLPITAETPIPAPGTPLHEPSTSSADAVLDEPTPEPGPSTEPDGGTREGED